MSAVMHRRSPYHRGGGCLFHDERKVRFRTGGTAMNTTAMAHSIAGTATAVWDLEHSVDHLADIVEHLLRGSAEFVCSLDYAEAEALAEVLDAAHHTDTAARLMHRWALTEPDWGDDIEHSATLHHWLALSVEPGRVAALAQ